MAASPERTDLALALGGGALRGVAHIGVLQVLHEHGIYPSMVTGTSAGSLVGAFYAAGIDPYHMAELTRSLTADVLVDTDLGPLSLLLLSQRVALEMIGRSARTPSGIAAGRRLEAWIRENLPVPGLDQLSLPFACVAVDIRSGERVILGARRLFPGEPPLGTVFLSEEVADTAAAVRASSSIPWFYAPKRIAGRILVDGGVAEPVPAPTARLLGARKVAAVDVAPTEGNHGEIQGLTRILGRSLSIGTAVMTRLQLEHDADVVIHPRLRDAPMTESSVIPEYLAAGRVAAMAALPALEELLRRPLRPRRRWFGLGS
ncbi:patatin-like phospholipase family protein [Limnochorda pilosa]|uniref:Patatin n=1 Tax=Limnochorda pilosa TaxID=1555112 RepID=A0A0K2SNY4_LIMPI|nr:patatin-like phospholipase family protein [Limnochorda pilosa]BAS28848.1 patatin [Limnochorda pilosa]